ncbi:hypothetical protein [Pontibacter beigongshangensis]|uniref:hypothetical protein n=1 Tax=Pontibacter beigongshangensis TaxID=2574733 RepID=UPI00164FB933|nr:hypothetical protein [Pontibacter beigongshangensis]
MSLELKYVPDDGSMKSKYYIIVAGLRSTIIRHQAIFQNLLIIDKFLDITLPPTENDEDYLARLDALCQYLSQQSVDSYLIRHLYHNLRADVEAVRNKTFFFNHEEHYIVLPE